MTWKDLLTTYSSFTTLLLLAFGYLIKRIYDLKSKKVEVQFTTFQQKKIEAIARFFEAYNSAERMWHQFPIRALNKETDFSADDMDKLIWPSMNALKMSISELHIFLNEKQLKPFEEILKSFLSLNETASAIYFGHVDGDNIIRGNNFAFKQNETQLKNEELIKNIGENVRGMYKIK